MTDRYPEPSDANNYFVDHIDLLRSSFKHWTDRNLAPSHLLGAAAAEWIYRNEAVVVSHNGTANPVFTYGNLAAQSLFEMDWQQFTQLPSRQSAEPDRREERSLLLQQVAERGFVDGYSGIRISATGKRFVIADVTVWNLIDASGHYCGQAATYSDCRPLSG